MKAKNFTEKILNSNHSAQPNPKMTIEELSEKMLIPSEILPYFREIEIETIQDMIDFNSESKVYKKYIKIRLGEEIFDKLTSAMRTCQKAYINNQKEQERTIRTKSSNQVQSENKGKSAITGITDLNNSCSAIEINVQKKNLDVASKVFETTSKVKTIKEENATEYRINELSSTKATIDIDNFSNTQSDKKRNYNSIEEMLNRISLEEIYNVKLLSREDFDLLKKSGFKTYKYVKEFQNLSIGSKSFLKTQLSFDEYWRIVDLANDFNKQSFIERITKALWNFPEINATETEEKNKIK